MFLVVALMVHEPDAAIEVLPHQGDVFLLCLPPVGAGSAENENILVGNACPVEPFHQNGQVGAGLLPTACDVGDEDAHLVPGLDGLLNGAGADGVVQCIFNVFPHSPLGQLHRVGVDFRHYLLGVQRHTEFRIAVFHGFHIVSPSINWDLHLKVRIQSYRSTLHWKSQESMALT